MRLFIFLLFLVSINCLGQSSNGNGRSYGIGAQVFEPMGINFQAFRGFFNNSNSFFATYGVLEIVAGKKI